MSRCGNIVLVGLSGAGKTSCAQILAGLLDLAVLDTDAVIQENAGMSVAGIFAEKGEEYFRTLERQLIEALLAKSPPLSSTVLSVGGGLPAQADNVQLLKKLGFTVFLNANPRTLAHRLSQDVNRDHGLRPLLNQAPDHLQNHVQDHIKDHKNDDQKDHKEDCKEENNEVKTDNLAVALGDQLARRRKYYEEAHLVIDTDGKSKQDICLEIQSIIINQEFPPLAL
jgi:shikimate kinase